MKISDFGLSRDVYEEDSYVKRSKVILMFSLINCIKLVIFYRSQMIELLVSFCKITWFNAIIHLLDFMS